MLSVELSPRLRCRLDNARGHTQRDYYGLRLFMAQSGLFGAGLAGRPLLGVKQTFPRTIQMVLFYEYTP